MVEDDDHSDTDSATCAAYKLAKKGRNICNTSLLVSVVGIRKKSCAENDWLHPCVSNIGLPLGREAPVMTPNGVSESISLITCIHAHAVVQSRCGSPMLSSYMQPHEQSNYVPIAGATKHSLTSRPNCMLCN